MSLPEIGSHVPNVRKPAANKDALVTIDSALGLNVAPGSDDDGWVPPSPVRLKDGSFLQLYKDGEGLLACFEAIRLAKTRICLETYIWRPDATGKKFLELLCQKSREGVHVFVIYDSFGSDHKHRWMFKQLRRAGVRLAEFHPIRPWECKFSWRPMNRDHRKLCVIDSDIAWMGGLNIGDEYGGQWVAGRDADTSWLMRDTAISIVGPSAQYLHRSFARTWSYIMRGGRIVRAMYTHNLALHRDPKGRRIGKQRRLYEVGAKKRRAPRPPELPLQGEFAVMASVPTLISPLRPVLYSLLRNAKKSVRMIMAYFAPDDDLVTQLCDAAERGCTVQLIFAAMSDINVMMIAARSFYDRLMDAGIEIYERQGVVLHAKTMTVDGRVAVVGSTNLDYRSIEFNLELSTLIDNETFTKQVDALMAHDIKFSRRMNPTQWRERPKWDRFVQWCVSRVRYLL